MRFYSLASRGQVSAKPPEYATGEPLGAPAALAGTN